MSELTTNNNFKKNLINNSIKISISIAIIIGFYAVGKLLNYHLVKKIEENDKKKISYELFANFLDKIILIIGVLIALVNLGFQLNTLLVVFGSIGLAVALAIQGTIKQLVSGFAILYMDYLDIDDLIQVDDKIGYVKHFNLLNTTIIDPGKVLVRIPNNLIINNVFTNISKNETIYCMIDLSISANNNIDYSILIDNIKSGIRFGCKYVLDKNDINVYITDFGNPGTKLSIRFPIKNINYFNAQFDARIIIRNIVSKDSIILLDNSYFTGA